MPPIPLSTFHGICPQTPAYVPDSREEASKQQTLQGPSSSFFCRFSQPVPKITALSALFWRFCAIKPIMYFVPRGWERGGGGGKGGGRKRGHRTDADKTDESMTYRPLHRSAVLVVWPTWLAAAAAVPRPILTACLRLPRAACYRPPSCHTPFHKIGRIERGRGRERERV